MQGNQFQLLEYKKPDLSELTQRAHTFKNVMHQRRSVRSFSDEPVPRSVIDDIIMTASSAPSGAHKQPWTFCIVSDNEIKTRIREAAEKEEYENYHGRMSDEWLQDLEKFETNWHKEFLTIAPYLIVIFKKSYDLVDGQKSKNYYVAESVGIAAGLLIASIHMAGLVTLTHTPSPMNFLQEILGRPENERPFLLLPIGYPSIDCKVPVLERKKAEDIILHY